MLKLEINRKAAVSVSDPYLEKIAAVFSRKKKLKGMMSCSLAFVKDSEIRRINRDYRGKDKVTDVLSFDEKEGFVSPNKEKNLGEIIIAVGQAKRQAKEYGWSLKNEIARLFIHGLAHLAGYDHEQLLRKKRIMERFEEEIMVELP